MGNKDITQATPRYQLCHIVEQGDHQVYDGAGRESWTGSTVFKTIFPPKERGTKTDRQ